MTHSSGFKSASVAATRILLEFVPSPERAVPRTSPRGFFRPQASAFRDGLPILQPLSDQFRASPVVASVQDARVLWVGAQVDTGSPRIQCRVCIRTRRPVSRRAIGGFHPDLASPVQLRRVRVLGPFSLPIVENARRLLLLLRRFAPVSRRDRKSTRLNSSH